MFQMGYNAMDGLAKADPAQYGPMMEKVISTILDKMNPILQAMQDEYWNPNTSPERLKELDQ